MTIDIIIDPSATGTPFQVDAVPRVGEDVYLGGTPYTVTRVAHQIQGRGSRILVHIDAPPRTTR